MNFFLENWILFALAATSGGLLLLPMLRSGGGNGSVGTAEAVRLINREKGVLVDVAEPDEFASGHAAGARNIPLGQLEGHKALPTNKTLPLLLMCPSGARAGRAAALLRRLREGHGRGRRHRGLARGQPAHREGRGHGGRQRRRQGRGQGRRQGQLRRLQGWRRCGTIPAVVSPK